MVRAGAYTLSSVPDPIPAVLCFDVEPDEVDVAPEALPWLGFEQLLERVGSWRDGLAVATGHDVRFTWCLRMDPQIAESHGSATWVIDRYDREIDALRSVGDRIGLHPRALRQVAGTWVADHRDPAWVDHCIWASFDTYKSAFGEPCRVQRFGDRFMTGRAIRLAAELGARYDLTIEPGARTERSTGPGRPETEFAADMRSAPRHPYRPSPDDPLRPGDGSLWMIPLTSMDPAALLPSWRRAIARIRNPGGPWYRPSPLAAPWPAATFWPMVERELATLSSQYLAFAIRSDAPLIPHHIQPIEEKLAALMTSPLAERLVFGTPEAVAPNFGS